MEGWIEWHYENSQSASLRRETSTARFVARKKKREHGMEKKSVAAQDGPGRLSTKLTQ